MSFNIDVDELENSHGATNVRKKAAKVVGENLPKEQGYILQSNITILYCYCWSIQFSLNNNFCFSQVDIKKKKKKKKGMFAIWICELLSICIFLLLLRVTLVLMCILLSTGKLPKNCDPKSTPDPERWLPMRERSYYRGRKKGKKKEQVGRGTQGATSGAAAELWV